MNKMKRTFALVAAAAGITLAAGSAQAVSSIDFVWNSTSTTTAGSLSTPLAASAFITGSIVLTGDGNTSVPGPWLIVFTMNFDTVELDFAGAKENVTAPLASGMANLTNTLSPITAGVNVDEANGIINQLDWSGNFSFPGGCQTCVVTLGTVKFHVVQGNGPQDPLVDRDITMGLFTPGLDGTFAQSGAAVTVNFGDAAAVVPEPTTALLVIGGLLGLGYAGRRSAR